MEEVEKEDQCITMHPGFESVCLNRWVLQTAGIGLKTKLKKSYTTMLTETEQRKSKFLLCFREGTLGHIHSDSSTAIRECKPLNFLILLFEEVPIAKRKKFYTCTKYKKILGNCKGENHIEKTVKVQCLHTFMRTSFTLTDFCDLWHTDNLYVWCGNMLASRTDFLFLAVCTIQ